MIIFFSYQDVIYDYMMINNEQIEKEFKYFYVKILNFKIQEIH